ncbi:hypothetical protein NEPAR06_1875, partial [Nematocida parisii]
MITRMRILGFILIMHACLIILTKNTTVHCTSIEDIFNSLVDNTSNYTNPQYAQNYSHSMVNEDINNPYGAQEEPVCSDTSIIELMKIPTSDLFNPEPINTHSGYNPNPPNQTMYTARAFNNPTQMVPSQYTSNNPLYGGGSSRTEEAPSSLYANIKRKLVEPIKSIFPKRFVAKPPIFCVTRDSYEYKKFIEKLHKHRLSVKNNNENNQHTAPSFYNQIVDNIAVKNVNKELIDRISTITKKNHNLWTGLQSIKEESTKTKLAIIKGVLSCFYNLSPIFQSCEVLYYNRIMQDLNNYFYRNIISSYNTHIIEDLLQTENRIKLNEFNPYKSTLGDIYIKNNINHLWHAESILMSCTNIHIECSNDLPACTVELKRQLLFILCIPEIYEDLFYMKYEDIDILRDLIIKSTSNRIYRPIHNMFCIIEYLHGFIHKNAEIMDASFKKIQEIDDIVCYLYDVNYITIYHFVYTVFAYFYKYSLYLYKIDTKVLISNTDPQLQKDCNYMAKKKYTKIPEDRIISYKGKDSVMLFNYIKCMVQFKCISGSMPANERMLDNIIDKQIRYNYVYKENMNISYCHHYHVQVVDNSAHRVHIMHIPFFVFNDDETIKYNYIHTLEDIVDYIKRVSRISEKKKNTLVNNVYPFKYNRAEKTWSMVTKLANTEAKRRKLDVTENEMN